MNGGVVPVFSAYSAAVSVQIQLIETEDDQNVFGHLQFLIGILILHPQPLHDRAAAGVIDVVCGREVRNAVSL